MNEEIAVDIEVDVEQQEIPIEVKSDVLKGDKGDKGEKGDPTATIEINQVITGEPGTSVIIENVGTDVNMKLDITIPRGYKGDTPLKGIDYYTEVDKQELINEILSQVNQFSVEVVSELPTEEIKETTIYFVPKENSKQKDVYDEYIYINNDWEHIGTTEIDLSNYYNKVEVDSKVQGVNNAVQGINNKIDNLSKNYTGTNITALTCEGFGKIKKLYGKTEEIGEGEKSPDNPYEISCVADNINVFDLNKYKGIDCVLNGAATVTDTEITIKASSNNSTYTTIGLENTGSVIAETYRQYCMEIPEGANKLIVNFKNNNTVRLASIYYNVLDENYTVLSGISRIYNSTDEEGILQADINVNNAKYVLVRFDTTAGGDVTYKNIALGNLDKYSPYGEGTVKITSTDGTNTSNKVIACKPLCCLKDSEGNIIAQDYIDFTRQKIIRQCGYISSYNSESITTDYISSTGSLTTGATVVYKLEEQIEEDIDTTNSIVQYADETTIYNSDNAEMEIELTNNKTVSRINENAKTLQEEINNYKKSIKEELLEQKEKIENKGKWVKLAETTSTTNEELNIDDLSKYTSLILQVLVSDSKNNVLQSTTGTVEQFKNSTFWQVGFSGNPTTYFVDCSYVSNTKVKMRSKSNADKGILWGII